MADRAAAWPRFAALLLLAAPCAAAEPPTAWLYVSAADSVFLTAGGGHYTAARVRTEGALRQLGFQVRHVETLPPPPDAAGRASLLVLDHAGALGDADWRALLQHLATGGGVAVAGAIGVRDAHNGWRGWDRMRNLFGARAVREMRFEETDHVTLGRTAPLAPVRSQGQVLALLRTRSCIGLEVETPAATWTGWKRQPLPAAAGLAAAVVRRHGAGRLVWIGFPLGCFAERERNAEAAREWLGALFDWLHGDVPRATFEAWPEGREAAVVLAEDSEHEFENAAHLAAALDQRDLPATFFCVSDLARAHPALVRGLAHRHEIGSHTDDHRSVAGLPRSQQHRHLEGSRRALERLSGRGVHGFRPPEEKLDATTLGELARSGYRYWVPGYDAQAMPEIVTVPVDGRANAMLVRIPRLGADDFELQVLRRLAPDSITTVLGDDLRRLRAFHGVQVVSLHTQILGRPGMLPAFLPFLDALDRRRVWVATAGDLAEWWVQRATCDAEIEGARGSFLLRIADPHEFPVAGLVARFCLPGGPARVHVSPADANRAAAAGGSGASPLELRPDPSGCFTLSLPPAPPGKTLAYRITY